MRVFVVLLLALLFATFWANAASAQARLPPDGIYKCSRRASQPVPPSPGQPPSFDVYARLSGGAWVRAPATTTRDMGFTSYGSVFGETVRPPEGTAAWSVAHLYSIWSGGGMRATENRPPELIVFIAHQADGSITIPMFRFYATREDDDDRAGETLLEIRDGARILWQSPRRSGFISGNPAYTMESGLVPSQRSTTIRSGRDNADMQLHGQMVSALQSRQLTFALRFSDGRSATATYADLNTSWLSRSINAVWSSVESQSTSMTTLAEIGRLGCRLF